MEFLRIAEEALLCKDSERAGLVNTQELRTARRSRLIADQLIDEKGQFSETAAKFLLSHLHLPIYAPFDLIFQEHVKHVIQLFMNDSNARLRLRQLSFPLANPYVEKVIRHCLLLREGAKLEKRHISQAVVAALLTLLRQSVGSCFATAPLIIAQQEETGFLFQDLYDLITRGFLKRVIDGEEMKAPISTKTGHGDLLKTTGIHAHLDPALKFILGSDIQPGLSIQELIHRKFSPHEAKEAEELFKAHVQSPLLKCYEYTVATFSDWKTDFYRWNMFTGLGLAQEEAGGIGEKLYSALSEKLDKTNAVLAGLQEEIERGMDGLRAIEALLKNAYDLEKIRRLKNEFKYKEHGVILNEEEYQRERKKGELLAKGFKFLIEQFIQLFPFYFQEVFDPEMVDEEGAIYEDRPAGFRLIYKHGRLDPSVWTMIYDETDYKNALIDFFKIIEPTLTAAWGLEAGRELISQMIDQVIERIQDPIFIQTAIERTERMHREALSEKTPRKPWAYISGGNVESVVKCYYSRIQDLMRHQFFPSAPLELCVGLIEFMKDMPYPEASQGLLMQSPTHAFVLRPRLEPFYKAWQERGNTFTYVRDEVVERSKAFYDTIHLSPKEIEWILGPIPVQGKTIQELYQEVEEKFPTYLPLFEERLMTLLLSKGAPRPLIFADSNWGSDFFAFLVSPHTGELELWRFDGQIARPLPSWKDHFNKKAWSILLF